MRILHVINTLDEGGAERLVLDLAPRMTQVGVECLVYVLSLKKVIIFDQLVRAGIKVKIGEARTLYAAKHITDLRRFVLKERVDIVHAHLFPSILWCSVLSRGLVNCPVVTTEHSTRNRRRRWFFRPTEKWMYDGYESVVCISEGTADALRTWLPFMSDRICVISNGIDFRRFDRVRAKSDGDPFKLRRIISVGRLTEQKGFDILLRGLVLLPDIEAQIVGDGPLRQQLEALVRTLGIGGRVTFMGPRSDVPELLLRASVYVQSSRSEGFGLATVEAMYSGLPVIVSDVPGMGDIVGQAGLRFPRESPEGLAERVRYAFSDSTIFAALSSAGRARATEFSVEKTADQYVALYRRLVTLANGTPPAGGFEGWCLGMAAVSFAGAASGRQTEPAVTSIIHFCQGLFMKCVELDDKSTYPKISVVTPSFNQGAYLEKTIESVLAQNYPNLEFIVIDGGSTDASVDIIRRYAPRITYWHSRRDGGQSDAIRQGFEIATGEILCWLNSDDIFLDGALYHIANQFSNNPSADVINGGGYVIDEYDRPKIKRLWGYSEGVSASYNRLRFYGQEGILQQSTFWRREAYRAVGGIHTRLYFIMDLDLFTRLAERKRFLRTKRLLACFRVHSESKTTNAQSRYQEEMIEFRNQYSGRSYIYRLSMYYLYRTPRLVVRLILIAGLRSGLKRLPSAKWYLMMPPGNCEP